MPLDVQLQSEKKQTIAQYIFEYLFTDIMLNHFYIFSFLILSIMPWRWSTYLANIIQIENTNLHAAPKTVQVLLEQMELKTHTNYKALNEIPPNFQINSEQTISKNILGNY